MAAWPFPDDIIKPQALNVETYQMTTTGSYGYDAASRMTSIAAGTSIRNLTYDAQNRQISGAVTSLTATSGSCTPGREASGTGPTSYTWGPDNQIESAQVSILDSVAFENRHYVLGQLLYQGTHGPQYNAPEARRALHLGPDVTIGLVNAQGATLAQAQLGVNDADFTGALTSTHNASGHSPGTSPTTICKRVARKRPFHRHPRASPQSHRTA